MNPREEGSHRASPHPKPGAPLPEPLRNKLEAFWGQDLSGVRIHTHPGLRVAAMAVGSDIWFAPGMYNPATLPGLKLLTHELSHVLQQRAGRVRPPEGVRSAIVQDASLEAEADTTGAHAAAFVLRDQDGMQPPPPPWARAEPNAPTVGQCMPFGIELECASLDIKSPLGKPKGTVICQDDKTFKAVNEVTSALIPVVEFVSDPPANSLEELISTATRMAEQAAAWDKEFAALKDSKTPVITVKGVPVKKVVAKDVVAKDVADKQVPVEWKLAKGGPIDGALQITVGVPLVCIPQIYGNRGFNNFGDAGLHETMETHWNKLRTRVRERRESLTPTQLFPELPAETWGFLWLVMDYLIRACHEKSKPFIKAKFDTLARTDFRTIFSLLPKTEQDRLSYRKGVKVIMRKEWMTWLMRQAMVARAPLTAPQHIDVLIQLSHRMIPWNGDNRIPPTFNDWLENIPNKDLFTQERGAILIGLGALKNKVDTVRFRGADVKAPILELRCPLGSSMHYSRWVEEMGKSWEQYQRVLAVPPPRPVLNVQAALQAREEHRAREAMKQRAREQAKEADALARAQRPKPPVPPRPANPPMAAAAPAGLFLAPAARAFAPGAQAPAHPVLSLHDAKNLPPSKKGPNGGSTTS
ncbi:DUF4157 domain-containing protein [Myxococcus sp. K38C18041901]|uniref:eCIS core domain-containing protein n=1 Tax=Myxococcus guangdongensis TaxID=2906760 RepID=UPI0020A7C772|nr:DUF4157 domain-containing protein [Myxococcus guangdongensis]MCP3063631.1 DUF4157 domain-containing protein [Myxococcus guangdongensis]